MALPTYENENLNVSQSYEDPTLKLNAGDLMRQYDMKKYSNLNFVGIETTGANILDVSNMTHLRVDAWTANITNFKIKLVDFGPNLAYAGGDDSEHELTFVPSLESWNTYDIPLGNFTSLNSTQHIAQLIFACDPVGSGVVFIDNVLFRNSNGSGSGLEENTSTEIQLIPNPATDKLMITHPMLANRISILNLNGQVLMELVPQMLSTEINISTLPSGTYFIQSEIEGQIISNRLVKL